MADYYVRATSGNDANAGTSHATAFQTVQKALDVSGGDDRIFISDEAVITLDGVGAEADADLDWTTHNLNAAHSATAPLVIQGYDNASGGAHTPAIATLDGVDTAGHGRIFSITAVPQDVIISHIKFMRVSNEVVGSISNWIFTFCEFTDIATSGSMVDTTANCCFVACYIHDNDQRGINLGTNDLVCFCEFHNCERFLDSNTGCVIIFNLFHDLKAAGDRAIGGFDATIMMFNTFDGTAANEDKAIDMDGSNGRNILLSNIFTNWSNGGAGEAIDMSTGAIAVDGWNNFFGNSGNDFTGAATQRKHQLGFNEAKDPQYTDAANDDYRVGFNMKNEAFKGAFGTDINPWTARLTRAIMDIGAVQRAEEGLRLLGMGGMSG